MKFDNSIFDDKLKKIIAIKIKQNKKYSKLMLSKNILNHCLELGYEREKIIEIIGNYYKEDDEVIKKNINKLRKKYKLKNGKEILEKEIITNLYQKGFTMEQIKKVI